MTDPQAGPALPGDPYQVPPREGWNEVEKWVWQEVAAGRIADVNQKLGWCPIPECPDQWGPERRLTAGFVETILLHAPWRSAIPRQGVRIIGALLDGEIDLQQAQLGCQLWLQRCRLAAEIKWGGLQAPRDVSFLGSAMLRPLDLSGVNIDGSLIMSECTLLGKINLLGAYIGCNLELESVNVYGTLDMDSVQVGKDLVMCTNANFADIDLRGAKVGDYLNLEGAKVVGTVNLESIDVGGHVFLGGGEFSKEINLIFGKIGSSLDLSGAVIAGLNLTGTLIGGELTLASGGQAPNWMDGAEVSLRNVRADALQDESDAWPQKVDLDGFTYSRFGGLGAKPAADVGSRGSEWFIEWLARDEPYTPQPYHQCAKVLREMGHSEIANHVLYAGRERERCDLWERAGSLREYVRAFGLWLLRATIGYGYGLRYFRSLWWVLGFVVLGTLVLHFAGMPNKLAGSWDKPVFFSLDLLLPIIQLHEPHYKIVLDGAAKYYFAVHKLMGYVLASFLIAGVAGLTK